MTPARLFWWGVGISAGAALLWRAREIARDSIAKLPAEPEEGEGKPPADPLVGFGGETLPPFGLSQADIIQAVRDGRLEYRWRELASQPGVWVFEDAGRINGVRVPVSARTTAAIAEILSSQLGAVVSPTTPLIEDLVYNAADVVIKPYAYDVTDSPKSVPAFNQSIERQIARQTSGRPGWGFVSCVGKSWVRSNMALAHPGQAINYGFHWPRGTPSTKDGPWPSVDGQSMVFQQPGSRHNVDHYDYSQTLRLCRLDGGVAIPSHETLRADRLWY